MTFKDFCAGITVFVALMVAILGVTWIATGNECFLYKFFAPKIEQVRRDTFEQSKAYRQGMVQELENMQFEYIKATPEHKDALASVILHRAADVPEDAMTPSLRLFINSLRQGRLFGEKDR